MGSTYKPEGYASVSVYIMAEGAQRVMDFLRDVFAATPARRQDAPDGSIAHAEVVIDDTVIMLAEAGGDFPGFPVWLHVYVPDVDATYARALQAGGTSVQAPRQNDGEPDKRGGFKDPAGNTWWVATQVDP